MFKSVRLSALEAHPSRAGHGVSRRHFVALATAADCLQLPRQPAQPAALPRLRPVAPRRGRSAVSGCTLITLSGANHCHFFLHSSSSRPGPLQLLKYESCFDALLADLLPDLQRQFAQLQLPLRTFIVEWSAPAVGTQPRVSHDANRFLTVFVKTLSFSAASRIWDRFLMEGTELLFRAGIGLYVLVTLCNTCGTACLSTAILSLLRQQLRGQTKEECLRLLSSAALQELHEDAIAQAIEGIIIKPRFRTMMS